MREFVQVFDSKLDIYYPIIVGALSRMDDNIEAARFELEKARFQEELNVRADELEIKRAEIEYKLSEDSKSQRINSPLTIAVITGVIGIISLGIANLLQSSANLRLEREKFNFNAKLERERFESALILKAIETGNPETATNNLLFLAKAGLINDPTGRITALEGKPENAPVLPVSGELTNDVSREICGAWQGVSSSKRYIFVCKGEKGLEIYENDLNEGLVKVGSGTISQGNVEVDFFSRLGREGGMLRLHLSNDAQVLEGNFQDRNLVELQHVILRRIF